jgi:HPt (histidine-containing phosphotransfer) domain-containing protein
VSADFDAELANMRRVYLASLPVKIDEIAAAVTRRALDDTHTLAHRLRGTAGSYGVESISTAIGAIEDRIDAGGDASLLWTELDELLASARLAVKDLA